MEKKNRMEFLHSTKRESKSAPFLTGGAIFFALVVSGCADVRLPEWMTGEPDMQRLEKQRAIPRPPRSQNETESDTPALNWPNLSQVPDTAGTITPQKERREQIQNMLNDKEQANDLKNKLEQDEIILEEVKNLPSLTPTQETP